ncbi:MAG: hypothetical protein L6461_07185 [Anaerolineae bacterium]|nr:hypothetical protein [Anaerolineae bacterium]
MFEQNSRYINIQTATLKEDSGREISYVRRRFLPRSADLPTLTQVTVIQGDRLDLLTSRTIGDPEQFWRVCDASNAMDPVDLTRDPGRIVTVPIPQPQ